MKPEMRYFVLREICCIVCMSYSGGLNDGR